MKKYFLTFKDTYRLNCAVLALLSFLICMPHANAGKLSPDVRPGKQNFGSSSKEYEKAGQNIVAALSAGDAQSFTAAINKNRLLDRVFEGMSQDTRTIKTLRASLNKALDRAGALMTSNLGEHTRLTFVRSRAVNSEHRSLVRVDMGDNGLNYLDFILSKDRKGMVKIIDWHDYAHGRLYTDSLRHALVLMLPEEKSLVETLIGHPAVDKNAVKQFQDLSRLARENQYARWLEKYNDLPDKLKYSRMLLVTRVSITSAMGANDQYRRALKDVNTYIGDDPTLSLLLIDHYFYEGDFEAAHRALNRLHTYTGGDAAIDFLHANIYLTGKNYPESIKYAQIAINQDPAFEDSYWTLLNASVYAGQYEKAVSALKRLESDFGYRFDPEELANLEGYERFRKSSIFTQWRDERPVNSSRKHH